MAVTDADLTLSSWQSCGAFPRLPVEGIWGGGLIPLLCDPQESDLHLMKAYPSLGLSFSGEEAAVENCI